MEPQTNDYSPVNIPTTGPVEVPHTDTFPTTTSPATDRKFRRLFTKTWLFIIIGLILVIALIWLYHLSSTN